MTQRLPHRLVPLGLLLCVLLAPGCGSRDAETGRRYGIHLQRGVEAYTRGDYGQALKLFQRALQFNKDDPEVYLYIGELYDDYLADKLKAIEYYKKFLERSRDAELNTWVKEWIADAEAAAAGVAPETDLVTSGDPEVQRKELLAKYARALNKIRALEKQVAAYESERTAGGRGQPPRLPWLLGSLVAGGAAAALLVAWIARLRRPTQPLKPAAEAPALDQEQVLGRYFWVENEFNLGTLAIAREDTRIRIESASLSTKARSVGYGSLENNALSVDLMDESGQTAPTVFRFALDGMSFTAEWTDDLGPGMAIGMRER
jgi:tetratricopeptide (TPR) repeat protein